MKEDKTTEDKTIHVFSGPSLIAIQHILKFEGYYSEQAIISVDFSSIPAKSNLVVETADGEMFVHTTEFDPMYSAVAYVENFIENASIEDLSKYDDLNTLIATVGWHLKKDYIQSEKTQHLKYKLECLKSNAIERANERKMHNTIIGKLVHDDVYDTVYMIVAENESEVLLPGFKHRKHNADYSYSEEKCKNRWIEKRFLNTFGEHFSLNSDYHL